MNISSHLLVQLSYSRGADEAHFDVLEKYQLDPQWIIAQCYDGAAVMSLEYSYVKEVAPHAHYEHCH